MTVFNRPKPLRTSSTAFSNPQLHLFILFIGWAGVQIFLFWQNGIVTELESAKYIYEAQKLLDTGTVSSNNYWLYSIQIILLAAAIKLNTGFFAVYCLQLFFNAFSIWILFRFVRSQFGLTTAFLIALLMVFNIPAHTYNSYLQTESLFYSFTVLYSCFLLNTKKLTIPRALGIILFMGLVCFTRPTGLLFAGCGLFYVFFVFARQISIAARTMIAMVACLIFLFILNSAIGSGGELDFMLPFRDERIICGVPTLSEFRDITVSENPNSLWGLGYYVLNNTEQFLRLAWLRTKAFFGLSRPYYSAGHNLYLYFYFFPFFVLALAGLKKWYRSAKGLVFYCLTLITSHWVTVILTCDDWHNRFFLTIVPYIYILSAPIIKTLVDKFKTNDGKRHLQT